MSPLNNSVLVRHAELVMGQPVSISEPFSAGQIGHASSSLRQIAASSSRASDFLSNSIALIP